jgi:hypothetical protein
MPSVASHDRPTFVDIMVVKVFCCILLGTAYGGPRTTDSFPTSSMHAEPLCDTKRQLLGVVFCTISSFSDATTSIATLQRRVQCSSQAEASQRPVRNTFLEAMVVRPRLFMTSHVVLALSLS